MTLPPNARIALLIAGAVALWLASGLVLPSDGGQDAAPAAPDTFAVRVVESVARDTAPLLSITGRTRARRTVDVRAEVAGRVTELPADEGDAVAAGAVLGRLEAQDRAERVAETRGRVAQREIEYKAAKNLAGRGFASEVRLAEAGADLEAARAELAAAEVALDKTALTAPFAGVVAARAVEIGDYATPGQVVFQVVELDPLVVEGFVSERQLPALRPGQAAVARLLDGRELEGQLTFIAPAAGDAARTFRLEVTVDNPGGAIPGGLTATLAFAGRPVPAHAVTPAALTLDDAGVLGVRHVDPDGVVRFAAVELLRDTPEGAWIAGPDLPMRARIIVAGQEDVAAGQAVEVEVARGP
jgi:membrane fusion protein, multidrug efflux system